MSNSKSNVRLLTFIILTCLLNWLLGGILWVADVKLNSFAYTVLGAVYMLVPAAVAVYLQKFRYKEQITSAFRLSFKLNRWFVVALLTPFVAILMGHNYPQHPVAGVAMMTVFCILLAPMITYISLKAKSVIAAAIFQGSLNAFAGFPLLYLAGGSDLSSGITGYAGFIALIIINLCLFLFDKFITKENIFTTPIKAMK